MSKPLYVVRRAFKSYGELYLPGTLLESLEGIKLARSKLNERKIVRLPENEHHLSALCTYFQERMGIDLHSGLQAGVSKGSIVAEPVIASASAPTTPGTKAPVTAATAPVTAATIPAASVTPPAPKASAPAPITGAAKAASATLKK